MDGEATSQGETDNDILTFDISDDALEVASAEPKLSHGYLVPISRMTVDGHCSQRNSTGSLAILAWIRRLVGAVDVVRSADQSCGMRAAWRGAFLLQVTSDLPNPAEYEADRHRD